MIKALPGLGGVLFFLCFIFGIFGIFGVNQFSGKLYNRCRTTEEIIGSPEFNNQSWPMVDIEGWLCVDDDSCKVQVQEGELLRCGNSGEEGVSAYEIDEVID